MIPENWRAWLFIALFVVAGVIGMVSMVNVYQVLDNYETSYDRMCMHYGYDEATDVFTSFVGGQVKIECDGKRVYHEVYERCVEFDKWHNCVDEEYRAWGETQKLFHDSPESGTK